MSGTLAMKLSLNLLLRHRGGKALNLLWNTVVVAIRESTLITDDLSANQGYDLVPC